MSVAAGAGAPWIWTSGPVSADRQLALVFVVVNPSEQPFHYGVTGKLERAAPDGWVPAGWFASSLDFWGRLGQVKGPGERGFVPAIGLGALPGSTGQAEYIRIGDLGTGRYRLSRSETQFEQDQYQRVAAGEFVISDAVGDLLTISVSPLESSSPGHGAPLLTATPLLVPPSGANIGIRFGLAHTPTRETLEALRREVGGEIVVQGWTGSDWHRPVLSLPIQIRPVPGFDAAEASVDLPALDAGPYQLSCQHPEGELTRVIWVNSDIPAV